MESVAGGAEAVALPASLGQERLWLVEQVEPGTGRYNVALSLRMAGPLDEDALRRAVDELAARHESLRTMLAAVEGQAAQVILPPAPVALDVDDLHAGTAEERERAARARLDAELQRPFVLDAGPLFRGTLLRLAPDDRILALVMHHAVADEASFVVMEQELRALYDAFAAGLPSPLGPPPVQFADFALWQREMLEGGEMDRQLAWWREQMEGAAGTLELPADLPRPAVPTGAGTSIVTRLDPAVRDRLWALARQEGATPFMMLLSLWQLLLGRLAGEADVVVGTPVTGRTDETEGTVGFFINTLALRASLAGNPAFRVFLRGVRDRVQGAFAHPDLPLDRLLEALPLERDASRSPLFQTMFVLAGAAPEPAAAPALESAAAPWRRLPMSLAYARYELTLVTFDAGDRGVEVLLDYAADLFSPTAAGRILLQLVTLAEAVAADPDVPVADVPLLPADELRRVLAEGTGPVDPSLAHIPAHRLIEAQAARTPDADALVLGGDTLSYGEMNARANRLARHLVARGVRPDVRVGIAADRTPEAIVALLAVLKAGGAYVPLDPALPADRAAGMVADADIRLVVGRDEHAAAVAGWGAAFVSVESGAGEADGNLPVDLDPDALAYVIYTSGSTGAPKGVMVRHAGLANLALAFVQTHGFGPADRVLMVPPLSFDASVGDVFPALVSGGAVVLHPAPAELNGAKVMELCRAHGLTMLDVPAALWGVWTDELASRGPVDPSPLRMVMMGGEAAALDRADAWARTTGGTVELVNHYGPTETTVCATLLVTVDAEAWRGRAASIPIGRPLANTRIYLLDARGGPAPLSVPGELCIGGTGVARGYLGQPALTAERFVPDPFADEPGARMYRTGDRVRWLLDGTVEFLGRTDHQVKVRGYRIEPAEVEAALLAHPAVREALVMVREDEPGRRRLVAYVGAPGEHPSSADLREWLRGRLPEYMVPGAFVVMDALPMTSHAKVDRRALPAPALDASEAYVEPRTETERTLAALWADVLGVARVGARDDFFDLGGHSLLALPLVHRVNEAFGVEVPLRTLFNAPNVAAMAAAVDAILGGADPDADLLPPEMDDDVRLVDDLRPEAPYDPARPLRTVFLTGATGYLGAYLLHGLLTRTGADVVCLVRAKSENDGRRRIADNVAKYLDWDPAWAARVVPVVGDLGDPRLGMTDEQFRALAERTDAIVHNGGVVNFTLPYRGMRGANVEGTAWVLRLACAGRAKPVHFVSTLGVHVTRETQGVPVHEEDALPEAARVHDAYNQTKWVADTLVQAVAARGLPVTLHRPARVGPDYRTGASNADDYYARMLRGAAEVGAVPDLAWNWDVAPVDQVAAAIVQAVVDPAWLGGTYHYFNPHVLPFSDITAAVREAGWPVEELPYAQWRARALAAATESSHPLHPLMPLFPSELKGNLAPRFVTPATTRLMEAAGVAWTDPDRAFVGRTLRYFVRNGVLQAPATPSEPPA
jgi:amino acid adenylation domain-containing protein/thioester reductase-like protein